MDNATFNLAEWQLRISENVGQVVGNNLARRNQVLEERIALHHLDEELLKDIEKEIEAEEEEVEELERITDEREVQLEAVAYKVTSAEEMNEVRREEKRLKMINSELENLRGEIESLQKEKTIIDEFSYHIGILLRGMEEENKLVMTFVRIDAEKPDKEYRVFAEIKNFLSTELSVFVYNVEPWMAEFEELTGEDNKFDSFKTFIPFIRSKLIEIVMANKNKTKKSGRRRRNLGCADSTK